MNLSRYDIATEFTAFEIASLMVDLDPIDVKNNAILGQKIDDVMKRIKDAYVKALFFLKGHKIINLDDFPPDLLISVDLYNAFVSTYVPVESSPQINDSSASTENDPFHGLNREDQDALIGLKGLFDSEFDALYHSSFSSSGQFDGWNFSETTFNREQVGKWISHIGWNIGYCFTKPSTEIVCQDQMEIQVEIPSNDDALVEFDPGDLAPELDIAITAFNHVSNQRDTSMTFKKQAIKHLTISNPGLSTGAVERIAVVINPDKAPGRKTNR